MKKILYITSFIISSNLLIGQTKLFVKDEMTKLPLYGVKLNVNGQKTYLSDTLGMVTISMLTEGDSLEVSSTFYRTLKFSWKKGHEYIYLTKKARNLKETTIIAQKPQIKLEAGKTTLETSNATIQQGTLKDLVMQIPGLVLDNNQNISVKGKTGFRILVDGKVAQLALSDMKTFIESIPATSIKSIEVMTNPGAQYDAEGKGGIINIKLKKDKREGFNTKLSGSIGSILNKYNGGVFSNYKTGKINVFGNYQFNYRDQWYGYSEERKSILPTTTHYYDYIASWKNINRTHNAKTGIDWFIDEYTTLSYTFDMSYNLSTGDNYKDNTSSEYDENRNLVARYLAFNWGRNEITNRTNGLSFRRSYDSSRIEWTADISHTFFSEDNTNANENFAYDPVNQPLPSQYYYFEPVLSNYVHNVMGKTDLSIQHRFAKFELGLKNEANFYKNHYLAYLKDYNSEKYTDAKYQNDFNYNENIFALYGTVSKPIGNFNLDLGLRMENTVISSNNPAVGRQYLNLFPNAGISLPLDSSMTLSLRYSRRIDRPSFNKLNNRIFYYNRYTANVGVPTLQPEIANIFSLQLDRSFFKGACMASLGVDYNIEKNDIQEINFTDSTYTSYFTYGNVGSAKLFSTYLNLYIKPEKRIDINLTTTYSYNEYRFDYNGVLNESKGSALQLSGNVNYIMPLDIKLSMNGWFMTNNVWAQGYSEPFGSINLSASKQFFKNRLNVELSCTDVLNSNVWTGYQTTGTLRVKGRWKPETRIAWLNLSYTFGKKINYRRKEVLKSDRIQGSGR